MVYDYSERRMRLMNILDKMNIAISYVEEHITDELDLNTLAQLACCSTYNFQRMFSFVTDISIVEYIRRRRLTLAALELQQNDIKIMDLALKYGYDSPVSFARAFQAIHGITPKEARKSNISLKAFPRMTFQIIIKGVSEMNYRIVKTESFKVFGIEGIVSTIGDEKYFPHEGAIWQENNRNGKYEQLFLDAGETRLSIYDTMFIHEMCRIHGLMNYKKINDTTYGYMQCSFVTPESKTDGYTIVEIPATTWAVFPSDLINWDVGSAMTTLNKRFYSEWMPTSEFEKADAPEFEMYGGTPEKGYIELWMPIVKKA
jgi:AraC family transcriptional regulator